MADKCLNTVVGRTLYRLFVENLFVTAITFDYGESSIAYPWGDESFYIDADVSDKVEI